jgi:hypothetical protein
VAEWTNVWLWVQVSYTHVYISVYIYKHTHIDVNKYMFMYILIFDTFKVWPNGPMCGYGFRYVTYMYIYIQLYKYMNMRVNILIEMSINTYLCVYLHSYTCLRKVWPNGPMCGYGFRYVSCMYTYILGEIL